MNSFSLLKHHRLFLLALLVAVLVPLSASAFTPELNVDVSLDVGDTVLRVKGKTSPNAFVTILDNSDPIGTLTAGSNGEFDKSFSSQAPGLHNIKVFAKTSNGDTTDTISRNVNLVSQAETTVNFFLPSTLNLSADRIVQGGNITFRGATIPDGQITIIVDNNLTYEATAGSSGNWLKTIPTDGFYIGTHYLYAVVSDSSGSQSAPTTKRPFQVAGEESGDSIDIDRSIGTDRNVDPPAFIQPPVISSPRNSQRFSESPIDIRGVALSNSQVEIWEGDRIIGSVFANHLGQWQFTMHLSRPKHEIRVRTCVADECSTFSDVIAVYFDNLQPDEFTFTLGDYRYTDVEVNSQISLDIFFNGGEQPYEAVIDWGDDAVETMALSEEDTVKFRHSYAETGNYTGTVTMKDARDLSITRYFSVEVREPVAGLTPLVLSVVALAGAVGGFSLYLVFKKLPLLYVTKK